MLTWSIKAKYHYGDSFSSGETDCEVGVFKDYETAERAIQCLIEQNQLYLKGQELRNEEANKLIAEAKSKPWFHYDEKYGDALWIHSILFEGQTLQTPWHGYFERLIELSLVPNTVVYRP